MSDDVDTFALSAVRDGDWWVCRVRLRRAETCYLHELPLVLFGEHRSRTRAGAMAAAFEALGSELTREHHAERRRAE